MSTLPSNEQIRAFLTNINWQNPIIEPVESLPPYPGANVGDRYIVMTGRNADCIVECRVPRRCAGASVVQPRLGMLVASTSTGDFSLYDGSQWTDAQPYFEQIGNLITGVVPG